MPEPTLAATGLGQVHIRRYTGTPPEMCQPAMIDNLICMHLGGGKEVRRWYDGRLDVHDVASGALTIMPASQSNRWLTRGPIDFAHILLGPELIDRIALEEFDHCSSGLHLTDTVGFRDPELEALFASLLSAVENRERGSLLYPESLLIVLGVRLLERRSTLRRSGALGPSPLASRGGMAPWRLRKVIDYMQAHLAGEIALADLATVTGLSRAQFFRAFKQSTGETPHKYLTALRLDTARTLIDERRLDPLDVGDAVGLPSPRRFTALFRERFGRRPSPPGDA